MEWAARYPGRRLRSLHLPGSRSRRRRTHRHAGPRVPGDAGGTAAAAGGTGPPQARAVLFLHGWSDYFFNEELARVLDAPGLRVLRPRHAQPRPQPARRTRTAATWRTWTTTTPRSPRRSASSPLCTAGAEAPPTLALMGHSTGGLIAALWAEPASRRGLAAGPRQPVAGDARQPGRAPCRADHGGTARAVPAGGRHPAARARLLLAQHQQRRRGRMDPGRQLPSAHGLSGPRRLAERRPDRAVARWRAAWTSTFPSWC